MGHTLKAECGDCGHEFEARSGGGFFFHLLRCDTCVLDKSLSFEEIGEPHLRYLKGLEVPYCTASREHDRSVRENYQGEPIPEDEYHRQVESIAGSCHCGGHFRFDAPLRCPTCRSANVREGPTLDLYD
jgi:hypothetical protein